MSIDATNVVHVCPLCGKECPTARAVKRHVTDSTNERHAGVNGFKMEKVIETKEKKEWNVDTEKELHNKIAKAGDYFDELNRQEIYEIADAAGVHYSRVCRVFEDEGIDYKMEGRYPPRKIEQVQGDTRKIVKNAGVSIEDGNEDEIRERINSALGEGKRRSINTIKEIVDKYGWMNLPIYDGDSSKRDTHHGGEVKLEGDMSDMIDNISDENKDNNNSMTDQDLPPKVQAFNDAGVEYSVEPEGDRFTVVKKLIEAGYDDLAEDIFDS